MQEHIRRAHPEHYISKLPATEESFALMISTPPSERPRESTSQGISNTGESGPRCDALRCAAICCDLAAHTIQHMVTSAIPYMVTKPARPLPPGPAMNTPTTPCYRLPVPPPHWQRFITIESNQSGTRSRYLTRQSAGHAADSANVEIYPGHDFQRWLRPPHQLIH
jgi:hypothetical protein